MVIAISSAAWGHPARRGSANGSAFYPLMGDIARFPCQPLRESWRLRWAAMKTIPSSKNYRSAGSTAALSISAPVSVSKAYGWLQDRRRVDPFLDTYFREAGKPGTAIQDRIWRLEPPAINRFITNTFVLSPLGPAHRNSASRRCMAPIGKTCRSGFGLATLRARPRHQPRPVCVVSFCPPEPCVCDSPEPLKLNDLNRLKVFRRVRDIAVQRPARDRGLNNWRLCSL